MKQSAITKPSTPSGSLTSFGEWVADVTAKLHPSLESAWREEVIKMTMYICAKCSISIAWLYLLTILRYILSETYT